MTNQRKRTIYRKCEDEMARWYLADFMWHLTRLGKYNMAALDKAMHYATLAKYGQ